MPTKSQKTQSKSPLKKIKPHRHLKWFILTAIIMVGIALIPIIKDQQANFYSETYVATTENIDITTTLSGRLIPKTTLDLRFNESGTIGGIFTQEGQTVTAGEKLSELTVELLLAERGEINAEINTQKAILNELLAGTRPEEISQQQAVYELALLERDHSLADLVAILQDAQSDADNAIRNSVDDFFINAQSTNPQLSFDLTNNQGLESEIEFQRTAIESLLKNLLDLKVTTEIITLNTYESTIDIVVTALTKIRDFLSLAALTVNSTESSSDLTDATLRTWRANIAAERNTINSNIQDIQNKEQSIKEGTLFLVQAATLLEKLANGSTPEAIAKQRAQIAQAQARLNTIRAKLGNRAITAPEDGLVSDIKFDKGETVTTQDTVITLISENSFEVELEVPELNISALSIGDTATVTFAAIGDQEFYGIISSIKETATTDTNLVPFYDVRVTIENNDSGLKAGLISDVKVVTDSLSNQIAVPSRYVEFDSKENENFVLTLDDFDQIIRQVVTTGARTPDGRIIILSGITSGTTLVIK